MTTNVIGSLETMHLRASAVVNHSEREIGKVFAEYKISWL